MTIAALSVKILLTFPTVCFAFHLQMAQKLIMSSERILELASKLCLQIESHSSVPQVDEARAMGLQMVSTVPAFSGSQIRKIISTVSTKEYLRYYLYSDKDPNL